MIYNYPVTMHVGQCIVIQLSVCGSQSCEHSRTARNTSFKLRSRAPDRISDEIKLCIDLHANEKKIRFLCHYFPQCIKEPTTHVTGR